jgi:ABC-type polysaccharide/polyol phosphate export permease
VFKQVITLGHHLLAYAAFVLFGLIDLTVYTLLAIPALILLFLMSVPITAVMAILFPRFRDLSRLITSFMLVLLMVTPIFWQPSMLTGWRRLIIDFNPIYYMVELVRSPLLGKPIDPVVALAAVGMTVVFWAVGAVAYRRYSKYVVFWL